MMRQHIAAFLAAFAACALAEFKLDNVFSSNMVLQQQTPISFFGTSKATDKISATFSGRTVDAVPDEKGDWRVTFPAMEASDENISATFSDGKNTVVLKDILIGEVWFCSGQSNMAMPIQKKPVTNWSAMDCEKVVAEANYPAIRYAYQAHTINKLRKLPATYHRDLPNGWVKCSPDTAHHFGAAAYFFGLELYKQYNVPIGLINASWGGTRIQPWISREGHLNAGLLSDVAAIDRQTMDDKAIEAATNAEYKRFAEDFSKWHKKFEAAYSEAKAATAEWSKPDFDDSSWGTPTHLKSAKCHVIWSRCTFEVPERHKGKTLLLTIPPIGDVADIYLNGELVHSWNASTLPNRKRASLSVGFEKLLAKNVLAIRTEHCYAAQYNQQTNGIARGIQLGVSKDMTVLQGWKSKEEFSCNRQELDKLPSYITLPFNNVQFNTQLYNGMVDAWTKLPVRGVIWYQGCSNAGEPSYLKYHKALINDWRAKWNKPDMPFLIVQLAGYEPAHAKDWKTYDPNKPSGYALTRDIQMKMLALKNVGLATAIDIGDPVYIHPANKQDVGKRLALEARRIAYGENIVSQGPIFDKAVPEGNSIRVFYKNLSGDLKTSDGKAPGAFAVAGADRKFVWADAKLDGRTVVVSSPNVPAPLYVRYAYAGYRGDCNLQNPEGLPAYPFLSDADNSNLQ